ncbi:MAG: hypothetical protein E6H52_00480 [Betaproteobacteria bacterium]|nr:MAG: hypothetical protein E6H52_00480 [Betaproteobacteria bacterium]
MNSAARSASGPAAASAAAGGGAATAATAGTGAASGAAITTSGVSLVWKFDSTTAPLPLVPA